MTTLFPSILATCQDFEQSFHEIPTARKAQLQRLSTYFSKKFKAGQTPKAIVICTHNSRRSHLGQLWLAVAATYYKLGNIATYSGGTEATAFNPRAVNAIQNVGFQVTVENKQVANPRYHIKWQANMEAYIAFSKKYEAAPNPTQDFAAIMVCTAADEGCPFVAGADFRIALPFDDPKAFDGTPLETAKYAERCRQIGRAFLYMMSLVE